MKYGLTIVLALLGASVFAQYNKSNKLVQVSGIVTDVDSNAVVPYVTITNISEKGQKHAANYQGYYSLIARPGDTLVYSAIGFSSKTLVLPEQINDNKYTAMVCLKSEIIYLPALRVNPWATVEEFNKDFLTLKIADDDMALAQKNLSRQTVLNLAVTLPRSSEEIISSNFRYNFDRMVNVNMRQTYPFLNPFVWGKLIQTILAGTKDKESK